MSGAPRRRLLVLAESAHPEAQSVSWIGWALTRALAERHDVHLVTRWANRDAILATGLREGQDFTAIDLERIERPILNMAGRLRGGADKGWTTLMALSLPIYYAFEHAVWRAFADRLRAGAFDLVHRITPVSPTMPSLMAGRCSTASVPFVLGPINGGLPWPAQFPELRRAEQEWLAYVRGLYRLVPGYAATRRNAAAILAGSMETLRQLPAACRAKTIYLPENAIDPARFPRPRRDPQRELSLQALFIGRLVPYKGCDMAIRAAAPALRQGRLRLTVVGDGPERPTLEALARREGVAEKVHFTGQAAPAEVHRHYAVSDLLLFPSVREFGGGVVLEAMTSGVVPLVVDYGGPGELVTETTGIKVPLAERDAIVRGLHAGLEQVLAAPACRATMAAAGQQRVDDLFTWQKKAAQISAVYAWSTGETCAKPHFAFSGEGTDEPSRTRNGGISHRPSHPLTA
jgi:glycosyltransferase involved in cell wall biosynthesis